MHAGHMYNIVRSAPAVCWGARLYPGFPVARRREQVPRTKTGSGSSPYRRTLVKRRPGVKMKYAIVESGGKQYRAVEGSTIELDRMPVEIGANVKLEQVLLLADGENITVGTPLIKNSPVWTTVLTHFRGEKVTIFNYSPKKRIRVKTGHRQNYTRLLVEQIGGSEFVKKEPVKVEKVVKAEVETPKAKAAKVEPKAAAEKKPAAAKAKAAPAKAAPKKPAAKAPAKAETKKPAAKKTTAAKPEAKKTTTKAAPKKPAAK
jgi:large subunit ribosomal protein L21